MSRPLQNPTWPCRSQSTLRMVSLSMLWRRKTQGTLHLRRAMAMSMSVLVSRVLAFGASHMIVAMTSSGIAAECLAIITCKRLVIRDCQATCINPRRHLQSSILMSKYHNKTFTQSRADMSCFLQILSHSVKTAASPIQIYSDSIRFYMCFQRLRRMI
jgi:hypothetical protein